MKKLYVMAIEIGLHNKYPHWDSKYIESIGQAMADLLLYRFKPDEIQNDEVVQKLIKLSYIFLSRSIELSPDSAYNSYLKRAIIFDRYSSILNTLETDEKLNIMSDLFYASQAFENAGYHSDAEKQLNEAKLLYVYFDNIDYSDMNVYQNTLPGLAMLGKQKNDKLYEHYLSEYNKDELKLPIQSFNDFIRTNEDVLRAS